MAFIELDRLSLSLGGRPILKELTGAYSGRCIGLLGPNGAGKTTLLQALLGFHRPTSGTARVLGLDIQTQIRQIRHRIGYMPENDSYIASMSAIRFVRMMAELSGLPPEAAMERAHETLFYVGLGEARYRQLGTYSLGMKQMAKLAVALVHGPSMVIHLVREIRDTHDINLIISSHLLRDIEEFCDEVMIMKDGRVVTYCNLEEERRANRKFLQLETRGENGPFLEAAEVLGCECAVDARTSRVKMVLPETVEIHDLYELAETHTIQIRRLQYKRDSLQDIFMKAMEAGKK
jgi:ABC-2 type transport system ATP-binding protein